MMRHYGPCQGEVIRKDEPTHFIYGCKKCGHVWRKGKRNTLRLDNNVQSNASLFIDKLEHPHSRKNLHRKRGCMGVVVKRKMSNVQMRYTCTKCNKVWYQSIRMKLDQPIVVNTEVTKDDIDVRLAFLPKAGDRERAREQELEEIKRRKKDPKVFGNAAARDDTKLNGDEVKLPWD